MKITKKISYLFVGVILTSLLLVSCAKDDKPITDTPIDNTASFKGAFVSSAHSTTGNATVNKEKTKLNFTDFKTDNGPNLDIYLVANLSNVNSDYITLGDIKGLNGSYTYDLSANTDFIKYKYIVVWCKHFNVNFGYATLAP